MSDIFVKTAGTITTPATGWRKASNIFVKTAGTILSPAVGWKNATNVWIKTASQWLKVWPTSGIFASRSPFIADFSSDPYASRLTTANKLRIGTSYFGDNAQWDLNGFAASSYSYKWKLYDEFGSDLSTTIRSGTGSGWNSTTGEDQLPTSVWTATNSTSADLQYLGFEVTANASASSSYNGLSVSSKIQVIRETPLNISASLTGTPAVGSTLSFSSSWNTTQAYKIDATKTNISWYKSTSNTDIYEGGSRVAISRGNNLYQLTLLSSDNLDGYYVIAEESVFNSGSSYDIGPYPATTNGLNRITKVTASAVTSPYVFAFGNNLHVGTNGYISLDTGSNSDAISGTTGRVLGILPADLQQATATSLWYWSNTTQLIIRWEGYVYGDTANLRQYEVVFDTAQNYVIVYAITVTSGAGGTPAFVKDGVTQVIYGPTGLVTGNIRRVYLDGTSSPISISGTYTPKSKSVMVQSTGLTSGTTDQGYTTILAQTNQSVTPTLGAFNISAFTKGAVNSSAQGATRQTTLSWTASDSATRYEIQYQGSNDAINWTTVQTYQSSPYNLGTSETKSWSTSGGDFGYYTYMRANIRASDLTGAAYVYSNSGSYVDASGIAPGQPAFGTITKTGVNASVAFTVGSQGTNYLYSSIEYQYRPQSGSYPGTWSTSTITNGAGAIALSGLSPSTTYYIKIRTRNYDELYSPENETSFATPSSVSISSVSYNGAGTFTVNVSGGGPYYQIYWNTNSTMPTGTYYDAAGTTSSISESLTPTAGLSYWFWARSSTQLIASTTSSGNGTAGTYTDYVGPYIMRLVSYDYNGGSGTTSLHVVSDGNYTTLPTPSARTGYTFNGWYTAASGGTYVGASSSAYYVSSTLTLYAQWTADTYAVTYYANGGSGAPSAQTKTYNVTLTLSSTTPTLSGSTFAGWNTNSSGTGTNYAAGASYTTNAILDLYAKWSSNAVIPTITMTANTGVLYNQGTINWSSTNQSSFSSTGTFSGTGTTATSIAKTGLSASTTYTGTVTVTSSTSNTASANYSLTTPAAPAAATFTIGTVSASRTAAKQLTGTWTSTRSGGSFQWWNTRVRNTATSATATHSLFVETPKSDAFTSLSGTSYRFGVQGVSYDSNYAVYVYTVGSSDMGAYTENGSNINPT